MRRILFLAAALAAAGLSACSSSGTSSSGSTGSSGSGSSSGSGGSSGTNGSGGTSSSGGADFALSATPAALSIAPTASATSNIALDRNAGTGTFNDAVSLTLSFADGGALVGLTGSFLPASVTATASVLTVTALPDAGAGNYALEVVGTAGTTVHTQALTVTVTAPADTLLVDNDNSDNNTNPNGTNNTPSIADTVIPGLLQSATPAVSYNTLVQPSAQDSSGPSLTQLSPYARVIWYCGDRYGGTDTCISNYQEQLLQTYLDSGNKTVIILYEQMGYDWNGAWTDLNSHTIFTSPYLVAQGFLDGTGVDQPGTSTSYNHASYTTLGVTGAATDGFSVHVSGSGGNTSLLNSDITAFNVADGGGTDALMTVPGDISTASLTNATVPIVIGRKNVGSAGTSKVVLVGMPVENVDGLGTTSQQALFNGLLAY